MLKRRYRLRDGKRLEEVRTGGGSAALPLVVLCWAPNDQPVSRCAFVVSRRIGKAVVRNRVRRRLSEAVRLMWELIEPGWDLVWIARRAAVEADFPALQEACVRLARRAGVLQTGAQVSSYGEKQ